MKKTTICLLSVLLLACGPHKIDKTDAITTAQQFVKEQLKAPTTASFSEDAWHDNGDSTYVVSGKVDAQNSYGAKIRQDYIVKMQYLGGDYSKIESWKATKVDLFN